MSNIIPYPMQFIIMRRREEEIYFVWADSSGLITFVSGVPDSWVCTSARLAIKELESSGWEEINRGKVNEKV